VDHTQISNEVGGYLLEAWSTGEVMHAPDCLNGAGAVLGFLAQMQARARLKAGEYTDIKDALMVVNTKAGERLYFGQAINDCLIGEVTGVGVWNYAAGALDDPEAAEAFDLKNLFGYVAATVGETWFGQPRTPEGYTLKELPIEAVRKHAKILYDRMLFHGPEPKDLTKIYGTAAHQLIRGAAGEFPWGPEPVVPKLAGLTIFMEAAAPMSKIDPRPLGIDPLI
jgi:hypothetical protein